MTTFRLRFQRHAMVALAGAACLALGGERPVFAQATQRSAEECFPACRSGFVSSIPPSGLPAIALQPASPAQLSGALDAGTTRRDPPSSSGVHLHDGFYLRMGIGLGGASLAADVTSRDRGIDGAGVESRGFAIPLEFAIGGTPFPGLVVGLGSYGSIWPLPHDKIKNYGQSLESDAGSVTMASSGPFVDWYFRPDQGLHAQAAIAFATATATKSADRSVPYSIPWRDFSGSGWSLMTGFGWETWVGEQWSAGILGRVQYGQLSLRSSDGNDKLATSFAIVGAMASFTYH